MARNFLRESTLINFDEAVVYRRAVVQDGILSGVEGTADIVLVTICPLTLGIEISTVGGVFRLFCIRVFSVPFIS